MNFRILRSFVLFSIVVGLPLPVTAQDLTDDAAPGADAKASEAAEETEPARVTYASPTVAAIMESNPSTPSAWLDNALLLIDLGEPELAKPMLKKLTDANLDDSELADLARRTGSARLLRLVMVKGIGARDLARSLIDAANRWVRDPQRLAELVAKLDDPSDSVRSAAIRDLQGAKTAAVTYCLSVLADNQQSKHHAAIHRLLGSMGSMAVGPLMGALETQHQPFKAQVARILGRLHDRRVTPFLVGPAMLSSDPAVSTAAQGAVQRLVGRLPSRSDARRLLEDRILQMLKGNIAWPTDDQDRFQIWHWNDRANEPSNQCTTRDYRTREAAVILAARLARDLHALDPSDPDARRLYWVTQFEAVKVRDGYDHTLSRGQGSLFASAADQGVEVVEEFLRESMDRDLVGAATAAAEILAEVGDLNLIYHHGGGISPLVEATGHADRRLRFAAVDTIMKLGPERPFAGSNRVAEAIGSLLKTTGKRRALVADVRFRAGQKLAAMLTALDYEALVVTSGRELISAAARSADVDLIILSPRIDRPTVREVLYQLRRRADTARTPIGIMASYEESEWAGKLAENFAGTVAIARPTDVQAMESVIQRLLQHAPGNRISADERLGHAVLALEWLGKLPRGFNDLYELQRYGPAIENAIHVPQLVSSAVPVLGQLGLPSGQRTLVDLASRQSVELDIRQAASEAFRRSTERHGILLTSQEIMRQYDRYNASETADQTTQKLLSSILDALEESRHPVGTGPSPPK